MPKKIVNPDRESFLPLIKELAKELKPHLAMLLKNSQKESENIREIFKMLMAFLVGIILLMAVLTYFNKISGESLLFLIGTVVGYIMAFMLEMAKKKWFGK